MNWCPMCTAQFSDKECMTMLHEMGVRVGFCPYDGIMLQSSQGGMELAVRCDRMMTAGEKIVKFVEKHYQKPRKHKKPRKEASK